MFYRIDRADIAAARSTHLDLRQAQISGGVTEIHVKATCAAVKITLPPHVHVVTDATPIMAAVTDRTRPGKQPAHGAPVVHVTGWALMSDITVRTRDADD